MHGKWPYLHSQRCISKLYIGNKIHFGYSFVNNRYGESCSSFYIAPYATKDTTCSTFLADAWIPF